LPVPREGLIKPRQHAAEESERQHDGAPGYFDHFESALRESVFDRFGVILRRDHVRESRRDFAGVSLDMLLVHPFQKYLRAPLREDQRAA
jgi:hypothetical protein